MSLSRFFYEPFYTLSDFDRLFDEAFSARTTNGNGNNQQQLQRQNQDMRQLRPRYLPSFSYDCISLRRLTWPHL